MYIILTFSKIYIYIYNLNRIIVIIFNCIYTNARSYTIILFSRLLLVDKKSNFNCGFKLELVITCHLNFVVKIL